MNEQVLPNHRVVPASQPLANRSWRLLLGLLIWLVALPALAQTTTVDLSLGQSVSQQKPALGEVITYTVTLRNATGAATANNVVVKNQLPTEGVTYLPGSAALLRGTGGYTPESGIWNVASVAPGDSAVLTFRATVKERGVWFNTAEVVSVNESDTDSSPNNQRVSEDDYAAVCFSVPILWYAGDEYKVSIPSGYNQAVWYRNNVDVRSVSADLAVVNADSSLSIKSPGTYRFTSAGNGCPALSCCDIEVISGTAPTPMETASLGDFVFYDNNGNGIQDGGNETGVEGMRVALLQYDATGNATEVATTTTSITGAYSFTSLTAGVEYGVRFDTTGLRAQGYVLTQSDATNDDGLDSDAGPDGITTQKYRLSANETNETVDAGIKPITASLGDLVFLDTNGNGQQDRGEAGVSGVKVTLYQDGQATAVIGQTTSSSGTYQFAGLTPGIGYYVVFDTTGLRSRGYQLTTANRGDDNLDSDADSLTGQTGTYTLAVGEINNSVDAGLVPACPASISVTVSADVVICARDTARITATSALAGARIRWYTGPTGGTALATVASGQPFAVSPATTNVYYAEAVTDNGCTSARVPTVVTVSVVNVPAIATSTRNTCPSRTVDLTAVAITNQNPNQTYEWYTSTTRSAATRLTSLTAVGAGTYYLFARTADGCYSNPAPLAVDIVDCNCQNGISVSIGPDRPSCANSPVSLTATLSGAATSVTWSANVAGTFSSPTSLTTTFTPTDATVAGGSAQITATTNDPDGPTGTCQPATSSMTVRFVARPAAPVGVASDDTTTCPGQDNKLIGFAPGARINWYNQENALIGTTESGAKLLVRPTRSGANIYYAEAISADGCTSATRTSVTVLVGTCQADLAVLKKALTEAPYSVGQTVFYSLTVSNRSQVSATQVRVTDRLPATLSFVGATPAADYNATTGVWTVGTMAPGSERNLLVQTTINAAGTITNLATVSSPENDPVFSLNDTSSVTIRTGACAVEAPRITSSLVRLCRGDVATLTATGCTGGTVIWLDGQRGASVRVNPAVTTTYSASCTIGTDCTSPASNSLTLTVTDPQPPTLVASAATVCPGSSVTLTASGCANGVYLWSIGQDSTASIVVSPGSRTTYTVQCRQANCVSTPATQTIDVAGGLPTPTITASTTVACPGEPVTLTVNGCTGTPVWSSTTATTGSIIVTPTVGSNTYTVYCRTGTCTSPVSPPVAISLVAPTVPTVRASADSVCVGGLVSLTAIGCSGTVVWNATGSNGAVLTGSVIQVRPTSSTSYFAQCRVRSCLSDPSPSVAISVVTPSVPIITASSRVVCSGDKITLTAEGCEGTVRWNFDNRIGASIEVLPTETREYRATCQIGACESEPSTGIRVTVNTTGTAPTVTASSTAVCSGQAIMLTASGCNGTVLWNVAGLTGPVVSVTATPTNNVFYAVCRAGAACGSPRSNVINVQVTPTPTPTITASTTVACPGESVTLAVDNCQGAPIWSTGATTSTIVVNPAVTTSYSVYCRDGVCSSDTSRSVTISVVPVGVPTISASATSVAAGGTITLYATGCSGDVFWSANGINGSNRGDSLVVRPEGVQSYYAQCRFRECLSEPSATITINQRNCGADAGTLVAVNSTVCADSATVTIAARANGGLIVPAGYSTIFLLTRGTGLVIQQTSTTPTFSVTSTAADYAIHTLVYNANPADRNYLNLSTIQPGVSTTADLLQLIAGRQVCADLDVTGARVSVGSGQAPVITASSLTVCVGGTVSLTATGCEGGTVTWSDGTSGRIISKVINSDLQLTATCSLSGCVGRASAPVRILATTPAVPTLSGSSPTVCSGQSVTLTASGCVGGTYLWSDGQTTGSSLIISPTADATYRVKCKIGDCESAWSAPFPVRVGPATAPTIVVNGATGTPSTSATLCYRNSLTLTAQGCPANGVVIWSNEQTGPTITVRPLANTTYTARCRVSTECSSEPSNPITVVVLPEILRPSVVNKANTCPFNTVDLTTAVTSQTTTPGGVFEFFTSGSLDPATRVADPTAVNTGTYFAAEKNTLGCYSLGVMIRAQVDSCGIQTPCDPANPAIANAGADATICAAKTYRLQGTIGGAGQRAQWTTSGTGIFDNAFSPTATYHASVADVEAGRVTLILAVSTNNPSCPVARDSMVLTIQGVKGIPAVQIIGSTQLCAGDSVVLSAPAGASAYRWNNNATTQRLVVKESGTYQVMVFDAQGCSSVFSEGVTVRVASPVVVPTTTNLRNTCPAIVANLTSALSTTTAGSSYEYRIGPALSANRVLRPDSVGAGTYYVIEKNQFGCISAPAAITVRIVNCATDTLPADVSVRKLVSKSVVQRNETVTYTIIVSNTGPNMATNVELRDVLPAGLEVVPGSAPNYTLANGVITKRIDSLPVGRTETIAFMARVLGSGSIVNTAQIAYLDQRDPNLSNNTSSVTVRDTSASQRSRAGLAKSVVGVPTAQGDSLIRVRYRFVLKNYGSDTLQRVQVVDDLAYAFSPNRIAAATVTSTDSDVTLKVNPAFTGMGNNTNLFDSTSSYVLPNQSQTFFLDVTVRRTNGDTTRSFRNIASVTASSLGQKVDDLSIDGGDPDPDNDGNPTNNTGFTSFTLVPAVNGPALGLALAVVSVQRQADNSYNVTYKATLRNIGNIDLNSITLTDSLGNVFTAPASFSVVGAPTVRAGSSLVPNTAYNGSSQANLLQNTSTLAVGVQDTVVFTVNVRPNGNNGPFYMSAVTTGRTPDQTQTVRDVSNTGLDPLAPGAAPTAVRFDLPAGLLGVAKSVETPILIEPGVYDIPYVIHLRNAGSVPLSQVQVIDRLSDTFGNGALVVSNRISLTADPGLVIDSIYSGQGEATRMLVASQSTLPPGATRNIRFRVRVNVRSATTLTFYNRAIGSAVTPDNVAVSDTSTAGVNDDPDNNLDPRNNSVPTPITLGNQSTESYIGVAKAVRDTVRQSDGSFNVTYQVVIRNYGNAPLTQVTLLDSLANVFNPQTGATYTIVRTPYTTSTGSTIKVNDRFTGNTDARLTLGDSTSTMAVGRVDTLQFIINVSTNGSTTTYLNTIYGFARGNGVLLADLSTNGLNPDLNGNSNPTDANEREPTPLNLPPTASTIFIPEGFSPNGDGINDLFVIRGTGGLTISLEVYNRWGNLVYKNDDYRNDWDGRPNTGVQVGGDASGLPDGTYYYVVRTSDGRRFVRYMTINR